jgi:hypothetical protein
MASSQRRREFVRVKKATGLQMHQTNQFIAFDGLATFAGLTDS